MQGWVASCELFTFNRSYISILSKVPIESSAMLFFKLLLVLAVCLFPMSGLFAALSTAYLQISLLGLLSVNCALCTMHYVSFIWKKGLPFFGRICTICSFISLVIVSQDIYQFEIYSVDSFDWLLLPKTKMWIDENPVGRWEVDSHRSDVKSNSKTNKHVEENLGTESIWMEKNKNSSQVWSSSCCLYFLLFKFIFRERSYIVLYHYYFGGFCLFLILKHVVYLASNCILSIKLIKFPPLIVSDIFFW